MKRIIITIAFTINLIEWVCAQDFKIPDTLAVQSENFTLKALLWRPAGKGPFATIIFCHGSYPNADTNHDPIKDATSIGSLFAGRGYIFLALFRRGVGLSKGQGVNSADLMENAFNKNGQEGRNEVQLQQLETDQLQDIIAGLSYLRSRPDVDKHRMGILGHSFGGSLALLVAELDQSLKAIIIFSGSGYSWNLSPQLRNRLISAVKNTTSPILIIHALNDYFTSPGYALDSVMNQFKKPHLLIIYPKFGNSANEGHNLIFLSTSTWEADVFRFLEENLRH